MSTQNDTPDDIADQAQRCYDCGQMMVAQTAESRGALLREHECPDRSDDTGDDERRPYGWDEQPKTLLPDVTRTVDPRT